LRRIKPFLEANKTLLGENHPYISLSIIGHVVSRAESELPLGARADRVIGQAEKFSDDHRGVRLTYVTEKPFFETYALSVFSEVSVSSNPMTTLAWGIACFDGYDALQSAQHDFQSDGAGDTRESL